MKRIIKKIMENKLVDQFVKFGLVGVLNTLLSLAIYYILIYFNIYYIIANIISFLISVLNSFFLNKNFVFNDKKKGNVFKKLFKVYLSYGVTLVLSTVLLSIQVEYFNIPKTIAPIINLVFTIPINFMLVKQWAFKV